MSGDEFTATVDGRPVKGTRGASILEVCKANNIYIPTLCHLDGLSGSGGCRLCLVDVEGQRRPVPACMTPAAEGMKIVTNSPQLTKYRRMALELLLSERNLFCFFCEKSGDCELQSLCYEFGIDHPRFPGMFPPLRLDASAEALAIDNNRCILCGRCVRVCNEVVANNTLDFARRGSNTVINEPDSLPLGQSNCIQCGACVEVCPTGAIFGKLSSYRGRKAQCLVLGTTCCECPMACDLTVHVRDNNIVMIAGGGLQGRFGGQLCKKGRFDLLTRDFDRVDAPRVMKGDAQINAHLPEALAAASKILREVQRKHGKDSVAGIISPRCTNEAIRAFREFVKRTLRTKNIFVMESAAGVLSEMVTRAMEREGLGRFSQCRTVELSQADLIVAIGLGQDEPHPIIASNIRRALNKGAHLVMVASADNVLSARATLIVNTEKGRLVPVVGTLTALVGAAAKGDEGAIQDIMHGSSDFGYEEMATFLSYVRGAKKVVAVAGGKIEPYPALLRSIALLAAALGKTENGQVPAIFLRSGGNTRGVLDLLGEDVRSVPADLGTLGIRGAYVLLSDEEPVAVDRIDLEGLEAIVAQVSFESDLAKRADVVIPSRTWAERSGTLTDVDGEVRKISQVLLPPDAVPSDEEIIRELARRWPTAGQKTEGGIA